MYSTVWSSVAVILLQSYQNFLRLQAALNYLDGINAFFSVIEHLEISLLIFGYVQIQI